MPCHYHINIHEPILTSDNREITKSRDMLPIKYPMHPQLPTWEKPSTLTQWIRPYHLVIPHLTLQVQLARLKLYKYLSQPSVSQKREDQELQWPKLNS